MKNSLIVLLLVLSAISLRAQSTINMNDGSSHILTVTTPNGMTGNTTLRLPNPPSGANMGYVPEGNSTGQMLYWDNATKQWNPLGAGTSGYVLQANGNGSAPTWVPNGQGGFGGESGPSFCGSWVENSVGNNQASKQVKVAGAVNNYNKFVVAPFNGTIEGLSLHLSHPRTGGTMTAHVTIDSQLTGVTLTVNANGQSYYSTAGTPVSFTAGQRIGVEFSSSSFTPQGPDVIFNVWTYFGESQGEGSGYVSGNGTAGRVPVWTNSTTIGDGTMRDDGTNVGIGLAPAVKLDIDGAIAYRANCSTTLVATATTLTVGNRTYFKINSNNTTGSRRLDLSDGTVIGQILILQCVTNDPDLGFRLVDNTSNNPSNINTNGNRGLNNMDNIELIWDGSHWDEIGFTQAGRAH